MKRLNAQLRQYDRGASMEGAASAARRYRVAQGLDSRDPASYVGGSKYRYFEMPAAIFDDNRLEPIDVRAYGILFDVERGGEARISLMRIGQRIGRTDRATERIIRRLESAGWLKTVEDTNGRCRRYQLTPVTGEQGITPKPPTQTDRVTEQTPATDEQGSPSTPDTGDIKPCTPVTKTPDTGVHLSIRSLPVSLTGGDSKKITDDEVRDSLVKALTHCQLNGSNAEHEADRLLRLFPADATRRLIGHARYAAAEKLERPVDYIIEQTRYGANAPAVGAA